MTQIRDIRGDCPSCGKASLHLMAAGEVHCLNPECPHPDSLQEILMDAAPCHRVEVTMERWALVHPLIERLGWALSNCAVEKEMRALKGPPVTPGHYWVSLGSGDRLNKSMLRFQPWLEGARCPIPFG